MLVSISFLSIIVFVIFLRVKRRNTIEKRLRSDVRDLKIKALTMQMNPHFIFNIINNIQSDLILKNTVNINDYIHAFSSLLRTTMNMTTSNFISVKNEIDYLEAYIKLQKYRLNNGFSYHFEITTTSKNIDLNNINIPCMLLQPIVENAILHGLEPKEDSNKLLKITIAVSDIVEVCIEDNGIGRIKKNTTKQKNNEPHAMGLMKTTIGLRNELRQNKITFQIIDLVDKNTPLGTKVVFKIPYK
ncbi:sensor histidine kinase [Tenacibaculum retecalamus]|uniref:sensor histidine kinase n=1 Tax=Tenacibaculum retecalamus TaxID=3018315 RepID=UPI002FDD5B48